MPPSNTADRSCLDPGSAERTSPFGADIQFFHLEPNQPFLYIVNQEANTCTRRKRNAHARPQAAAAAATSSKQQAASRRARGDARFHGKGCRPTRTAGAEQQARYGTLLRTPTGVPALPCPVPIVRWPAAAVITDGRLLTVQAASLSLTGLRSHKQETRAVSSVGPVA